jgi:hypothetical protein
MAKMQNSKSHSRIALQNLYIKNRLLRRIKYNNNNNGTDTTLFLELTNWAMGKNGL